MTNEPITPRWIQDDGHGWLAVHVEDFPEAERCGTGFGYQRDGVIYLEEDCEAAGFAELHPDVDLSGLPVERVNGSWEGRNWKPNERRWAPYGDPSKYRPVTDPAAAVGGYSRRYSVEAEYSDADPGL